MGRNGGLLIVNADDWGYDERTTEAISDCYRAGGLTSTTAMTFMHGSQAAASTAQELPHLGIGLHLNLVEEYTDPDTPIRARDRQRRLIEYFRMFRLRRWVYDPRLRHDISGIIADQLQCFVDLYGRPPTHLDGHRHGHLAANVLLSPALPRGTKIRNALSDAHRPNAVSDMLRFARGKLIAHRCRTTDYFFSIATVWPGLRGTPPTAKLALARQASVEVMVHPVFPHEYKPLQSDDWVETLRELPVGTFESL